MPLCVESTQTTLHTIAATITNRNRLLVRAEVEDRWSIGEKQLGDSGDGAGVVDASVVPALQWEPELSQCLRHAAPTDAVPCGELGFEVEVVYLELVMEGQTVASAGQIRGDWDLCASSYCLR